MQQWEEAQSQYEALRKSDPKSAEAMKKGMMEVGPNQIEKCLTTYLFETKEGGAFCSFFF